MHTFVRATLTGFFLGVGARSLFQVDFFFLVLATTIASVCIVYAFLSLRNDRMALLTVALVFLGGVVGVVRTEYAQQSYIQAQDVFIQTHGTFATRAIVAREPDVRDTYTVLVLRDSDRHVLIRTKVPHYTRYHYGDVVYATGTLTTPKDFYTEEGTLFHYAHYLQKEGIRFELQKSVVTATGARDGNMTVRTLYALKEAWLHGVSLALPEPDASLVGGVVVGAKQSLGESWLQKFRDTGIVHIVVLSGYNLTIVAVFIGWLLRRAHPTVRLLVGVMTIVAFAILVGGGATVVRASIMAIIGMLALFTHARYALARALFIAAGIMVFHNPFLLLFDVGFQLSFIATLGLIFGTPVFTRMLKRVPDTLGVRTIVSATLATQVAVLPLLLYHIGTVSLIAPVVNVLVLPVVPVLMAVGGATGIAASVALPLALPFALVTHGIATYIFFVVDLFSRVPFATITIPRTFVFFVVIVYTFCVTILFLRMRSTQTNNTPLMR